MIIRRLMSVLAAVTVMTCGASVANADGLATPTVLITGSSRGIGYELARQYAERGWGVIATCRTPERATALQLLAQSHSNVVIERLDVTDFTEIDNVAEKYRDVPIDVLINNAGILGDNDKQKFGTFDYSAFDEVMAVNTKGPIRISVGPGNLGRIMDLSGRPGEGWGPIENNTKCPVHRESPNFVDEG